jgi:Fe-Mn family superoxide dismutase
MRLQYPFDLPVLPYSFTDMQPYISEWTMKSHYERNHRNYVNKLNELLVKAPAYQNMSLGMLVSRSKGSLFEMSAQHFNHVFWWFSIKPPKPLKLPSETVLNHIVKDFGSMQNWKNDFINKAQSQFGSGWVWLVKENGKLVNSTTSNAGIPNFVNGITPLLVCDLWEHAYYCDYTTSRKKYIENWFNCINWQMVDVRYSGKDAIMDIF